MNRKITGIAVSYLSWAPVITAIDHCCNIDEYITLLCIFITVSHNTERKQFNMQLGH